MGALKYIAAAAALGGACLGAQALTITTVPAWNGSSSISPFGLPQTATYGQTIRTDSLGGNLNAFTFYLQPLAIDFTAHVFRWDSALTRATGPALFSSGALNVGSVSPTFHAVTVNTGGVALAANTDYVLLFTASGSAPAGPADASAMGAFANPDTYADGAFVFFNNSSFGQLNTQTWDNFLGNWGDLAFSANISSVAPIPEPSTYALMALGQALVGGVARRRAHAAANT